MESVTDFELFFGPFRQPKGRTGREYEYGGSRICRFDGLKKLLVK
jgi:hypothetical protein